LGKIQSQPEDDWSDNKFKTQHISCYQRNAKVCADNIYELPLTFSDVIWQPSFVYELGVLNDGCILFEHHYLSLAPVYMPVTTIEIDRKPEAVASREIKNKTEMFVQSKNLK